MADAAPTTDVTATPTPATPASGSLVPDDVAAPTPDATPSGDGPTPTPAATSQDAPDFTVEGFPDKFLDAEGKPDWNKLAKSYTELENKLHPKDGEEEG